MKPFKSLKSDWLYGLLPKDQVDSRCTRPFFTMGAYHPAVAIGSDLRDYYFTPPIFVTTFEKSHLSRTQQQNTLFTIKR